MGQCIVTPCRYHKTLRLIFGGILFLRIFGSKVTTLETPYHLLETPARHATDQHVALYDVGHYEGYP